MCVSGRGRINLSALAHSLVAPFLHAEFHPMERYKTMSIEERHGGNLARISQPAFWVPVRGVRGARGAMGHGGMNGVP